MKNKIVTFFVLSMCTVSDSTAQEVSKVLSCENQDLAFKVFVPVCNDFRDFQRQPNFKGMNRDENICLYSMISFLENGKYTLPHAYIFDTYLDGSKDIIGTFRLKYQPPQINALNNYFNCKQIEN